MAPPTTDIYTLSLLDALPIYRRHVDVRDVPDGRNRRERGIFLHRGDRAQRIGARVVQVEDDERRRRDRKSTRLNSSHTVISYAVFCLKKKKKTNKQERDGDNA